MLCGFCITLEYSVIKPICHSCFIAQYGAKAFPYAWLGILPLNFLLVNLYHRLVVKIGCLATLMWTTGLSVAINGLGPILLERSTLFPFFLYLWKDVYILLMFQQLWSVIHSTDLGGKQRFWYGILFGVGGFGTVLGSLIPGYFAVEVGSLKLLYLAPPVAMIMTFFYSRLIATRSKMTGGNPDITFEKKETKGGWGLLRSSRALKVILCLVIFMQVAATLFEYQFHTHLQEVIPDRDMRTAYLGKLFSAISSINLVFHFVVTNLIVRFWGLKKAHLMVPFVLVINSLGLLIFPSLRLVTLSYGTIKTFDYSFFAIIKEMLYVPLGVAEKFKAKPIIDVFAYRGSKALASLLVFLVPFPLIGGLLLCLFVGWLIFTAVMIEIPKDEEYSEEYAR